ncbi:MAG: DNA repair protein RecO [Acidaminococcales bacterium]|jgi:DNA repair protein RecO (recombination protein O)|nr:DNA repair protein RecO [Acidaminococcales bacterium]
MTDNNLYQDDIIILRARDWQTYDKIADAFSRSHGRILFIAYGARHIKNRNSALMQSLAHASAQLAPGQKFDTLRQCELLEPLLASPEIAKFAYASFAAELTIEATPEREPQEEIYHLLRGALQAMNKRNPRLVILAFVMKLFSLCGISPSFDNCVCCGKAIEGSAWASAVQGGCVCGDCRTGAEADFSQSARALSAALRNVDLAAAGGFTAKGHDLRALEDFLYKFVLAQIEKPLKSLQFLSKL